MRFSGCVQAVSWCSPAGPARPPVAGPLSSPTHLPRKSRAPHLRAAPMLTSEQMTTAVQVSLLVALAGRRGLWKAPAEPRPPAASSPLGPGEQRAAEGKQK